MERPESRPSPRKKSAAAPGILFPPPFSRGGRGGGGGGGGGGGDGAGRGRGAELGEEPRPKRPGGGRCGWGGGAAEAEVRDVPGRPRPPGPGLRGQVVSPEELREPLPSAHNLGRAGSTSGSQRRKARVPDRGARADPNGEEAAGLGQGGWAAGGRAASLQTRASAGNASAAGLRRVPYRVARGPRVPALGSLRRGPPGGDAAAGRGGPGSAQSLLLL